MGYSGTPEQVKAKRAAYVARNKTHINAKRRASRQRNHAAYLKTQRAYREANKERINEQQNVARRSNPERRRQYTANYTHGMRPEDIAALWAEQEGLCYLCGDALDPRRMHVDHDHSHCGNKKSCAICRRGLACPECNCGIGYARDDPARLRRMTDALEAAQAVLAERYTRVGKQDAMF